MFHSTFHLYFGAFDLILYAAAFLVSMSVSRAICDDLDASQDQLSSVSVTSVATSDKAAVSSNDLTLAALPTELTNGSGIEPVQQTVSNDSTKDSQPELVVNDQESDVKPILTLSKIRLYKLRKQSVVKLSDLAFSVPKTIKRYQLRRETVIKLTDLKSFAEVIL